MPSYNISEASSLINSISNIVKNRCLSKFGHDIRYSISTGVARLSQDLSDYEDWLKSADKRLLVNKQKNYTDNIVRNNCSGNTAS